MDKISSHKDLVVWQKALALAVKVYAATRLLPREERFGLQAQLRRAAVAVATEIAAGAASPGRAQFLQSLHAARGSVAKLETQFLIASRLAPYSDAAATQEEIAEVGRMLTALIRSVAASDRTAHAKACAHQR